MIESNSAREIFEDAYNTSFDNGVFDPCIFGIKITKKSIEIARKMNPNNQFQPEVFAPIMSLILVAWSSYILESKAICHYREPRPTFRDFLENQYLPNLKSIILGQRNKAIDVKIKKKSEGNTNADEDVPEDVDIPKHYVTFDAHAFYGKKEINSVSSGNKIE